MLIFSVTVINEKVIYTVVNPRLLAIHSISGQQTSSPKPR
jgi:hypothetical protein